MQKPYEKMEAEGLPRQSDEEAPAGEAFRQPLVNEAREAVTGGVSRQPLVNEAREAVTGEAPRQPLINEAREALAGDEPGQSFAYEIKGNSAVIWRCFSRDTRAELPARIEGYPVTEVAPYAFSAHMDEAGLEREIRAGRVKIFLTPLMEAEFVKRENSVKRPGSQGDDLAKHSSSPGDDFIKEPGSSGDDHIKQSGSAGDGLIKLSCLPALCGNSLEKIILPPSVKRVGRYCFYNCAGLEEIEFSGELFDWGSGVFTGCHRVKKLTVHAGEEGRSYLKEVLDELWEELEVELICGSAVSRLMFPEFYEEGVENTPARILETHVHGSGILYRNCFRDRKFDFRQYDLLFPHAKAQESSGLLARLTFGRLRRPLGLLPEAREQYLRYVREHEKEIAGILLKQQDLEGIKWLLAQGDAREELLGYMTEAASRLQDGEILSFLMDYRRSHMKIKHRRLEL